MQESSEPPESATPGEPTESAEPGASPEPEESSQSAASGSGEPRDVLAAEAFAVGAGDPGLHQEPARDVLAADEFPVPAPEQHEVPPDWQPPAQAPSDSTAVDVRRSNAKMAVPALVVAGTVAFVILRQLRRRRG